MITIYLSSTYEDLKAHRAHVIQALRKAGIQVDPMENWGAAPEVPKVFSKERIDGCDLLVLLVAFRRGYRPRGEDLSITQMATLVKFVCLRLANERLGQGVDLARLQTEGWELPALLPVRVVLRDYAARGLPDGKPLWEFLTDELQAVSSNGGNLGSYASALRSELKRDGGSGGSRETASSRRTRRDRFGRSKAFRL